MLGYLSGGPKVLGSSRSGLLPQRSYTWLQIIKQKSSVDTEAVILSMWDRLTSFAHRMSCP
jgi:hypothetical protein